jgi:hypothetical protein
MAKRTQLPKLPDGWEYLKLANFARVQLVNPDGQIVGDSGWIHNVIGNVGRQHYLQFLIAAAANSKQISYMAFGSGNAVAASENVLASEFTHAQYSRMTVATSTLDSTAIRFAATYASGINTTTYTINDVALVNSSTGGTIFCEATVNSSQWQSNQALNASYVVSFSG